MKTLKIFTPEEEKERMARLEKMVEPYWECAVRYFGYKKYPAFESVIVSKLKRYIYEAIACGIDNRVDAAAIAIIMYHRETYIEKNRKAGIIDAKSIEKNKKALFEAEVEIIRQIAKEFAECFDKENGLSEELFRRYDNYLKNMNIVELVDLLSYNK